MDNGNSLWAFVHDRIPTGESIYSSGSNSGNTGLPIATEDCPKNPFRGGLAGDKDLHTFGDLTILMPTCSVYRMGYLFQNIFPGNCHRFRLADRSAHNIAGQHL